MFIFNVRYGFATNSSSSHSIVLLNKKVNDECDSEFGWDFFTCSNEDSKRQYLGQTVKICLEQLNHLDAESATIIATKWCGVEVDPEGYIDHESVIMIPSTLCWGRGALRRDFFNDLMKFILREDVAILGGNNNEETDHPLLADGTATRLIPDRWEETKVGSPVLKLLRDGNCSTVRARYDHTGKFWSLFSTQSGTKVRFSFVEDSNADKSEYPELVDLKITDYCKKGCHYCYQGSTPKGKHADTSFIQTVSRILMDLEVFEVSLGGGEPTEHPGLLSIIDSFYYSGIVVNLTTRNEDWLIENQHKLRGVGAIGFSVDSSSKLLDQLSKIRSSIPNINTDLGLKFTVQVVVGTCNEYELKHILEICKTFHITVLLLGWKYTHRGSRGPKECEEVNLIPLLDSFWGELQISQRGEFTPWEGPNISFDTTLVNQMQEWLDFHADRWCFTTREGAHSMYIDGVEKTLHKSSYDTDDGVSFYSTVNADGSVDSLALHIKKYFLTL